MFRSLFFVFFALLPAIVDAQTLTLTSGNGQLQPSAYGQATTPIVFKVSVSTDPNSAGVPNEVITFTSNDGPVPLSSVTVVTNSSGTATVAFVPTALDPSYNSYLQYTITASIPSGSYIFYESEYYVSGTLFPYAGVDVLSPNNLQTSPYTTTAGAPGTPIQIASSATQGPQGGQAIGNVSVHPVLLAPDGSGSTIESVRCREANPIDYEGDVWTSPTSGIATCTPIFTLPNNAFPAGSNGFEFEIVIGDNYVVGPIRYDVLPAPLALSGGLINAEAPFPTQVTVGGGDPPYTFAVVSGTLPNGVTLNTQTGAVTGTPAAAPGIYPYTLQVTDAAGTHVTIPQSIAVSGGPVASTTPVVTAYAGEKLSTTVTLTGGVPPLTVKSVTGLPAGLSPQIQAAGTIVISGTAASTATAPIVFAITVTDATGAAFTVPVDYEVVSDLTVPGENPITVVVGTPIAPISIVPTTGEAPYTFQLTGQPVGITIDATGMISGTVVGATPGIYTATVTVTDALGEVSTSSPKFYVENSPVALVATSVPVAFAGLPYSATLQFSGGVPISPSAPYTLTLGTGAPANFLLTNGVLTGIFPSAGTVNVPVVVTDGTSIAMAVTVPVTVQNIGVVNAGSFLSSGAVAPGEIVSIFGSGFGPSAGVSGGTAAGTGNLLTTLDGVEVLFNNVPAPIFFEDAQQINLQVPYELVAGTSVGVVISINGTPYTVLSALPVVAADPGLFAQFPASGYTAGAAIPAIALNAVGSAPLTLNSASNAVPRGQYIVLYATGGGTLSAPITDGAPAGTDPLITLTDSPSVTIGGQAATVAFAGLAPGFIGLIQVNALVPESVTPGSAVPVVLNFGGLDNHLENTTIAVQ